jgi:hypothetical protein
MGNCQKKNIRARIMDDRVEFLRKKLYFKWRIHVLRLLMIRYYSKIKPEFLSKVEFILDSQLRKYQFDVEKMIDMWITVCPPIKDLPCTCSTCGYRPPFCRCHLS